MSLFNRKTEFLIFFIFILFTLIFTYPLIFKIDHSIFGDPEWTFDSLGSLYGIWWWKYASLNGFPPQFNHLVAFPYGLDQSQRPSQPGIYYPLLILSLIRNEFFAYNLFILSSFILTAIFMYYLVYFLTKNKLAGMLSGIVLSFCPNHFLQAFSHLGPAITQWTPLFVLSLIILREKMDYLTCIFCAVSFSLVILTNYYYGYFMIIFTAGLILFHIFNRKGHPNTEKLNKIRILKIMALTILICISISLPFIFSMIKNIFSVQNLSIESIPTAYKRTYNDLYKYSAKIYDYFLPSEYHPVLGQITKNFVKYITGGLRHWSERTLYLGLTPVFLGIISIISWIKRRKQIPITSRENFYIPFFLFSLFLFFYCSLPPTISFWRIKIPTPSFFLYHLLPMFRVYARMGFIVMLCVAVLAGFGLREILQKIKRDSIKILTTLIFCSLILVEYTVIPPFRNVDLGAVPDVYKWLESLPKDMVIAEYPIVRLIDELHYSYTFYQRIHQKRMINGADEGTIADSIRKSIRDLTNPEVPRLLSYLGASYVILHKKGYSPLQIEKIRHTPGLIYVRDFSETIIFKIETSPNKLMQVLHNFGKLETWDDGSIWQWMNNNAAIWLCNTSDEDISIDLYFKALSFAKDRQLEMYLNNNLIRKINIPPVSSPDQANNIFINNLTLPHGENILKFYTPEGPEIIDNIAHTGDRRMVSIAFSEFKIEY